MARYRHSDMEDLENRLRQVPENMGCLIVTDGVFSMGGDICKLPEIVRLARRYGARVMVDDAHGLGVIGPGGRGTAAYFGLEDEVDVIMGTVLQVPRVHRRLHGRQRGRGGLCAHAARPYIFCASIPPASCATAREALRILREQPELPERLLSLSRYMRAALHRRGVPIRESE